MCLLLYQTHSDDVLEDEDEDGEAAGPVLELPVLETKSGSQELDQAVVIRQEEFVEVERDADRIKDELKDKKVAEHLYMYAAKNVSFVKSYAGTIFLHKFCQIVCLWIFKIYLLK